MTEAAWIKLFDSIPGYISGMTALVMAFVAYRQLERSATQKAAALEVVQKVNEVIDNTAKIGENTDKIKVSTDGGFTDITNQLKTATEQNKIITEQNTALQGTVKILSEAVGSRTVEAKKQTGELIAEVKNGGSNTDLLRKLTELTQIMAELRDEGMPVIPQPDGAPLPVVAVKAGEVKK